MLVVYSHDNKLWELYNRTHNSPRMAISPFSVEVGKTIFLLPPKKSITDMSISKKCDFFGVLICKGLSSLLKDTLRQLCGAYMLHTMAVALYNRVGLISST